MTQSKKDLIEYANRELLESGNLDVIGKVFSNDYAVHADGKTHSGHAFVRKFTTLVRDALPDVRVVAIEFHVISNEKIVWERTLSGTHQKSMMGIPASHKKVIWRDMVISRFDNHMIAEEWTVSDLAGKLLLKLP